MIRFFKFQWTNIEEKEKYNFRDEFHKLTTLQPILNELMHKVAHDKVSII